MPHIKRLRGRPRGTGKDDLPHLVQVADVLTDDPSLKPTAAMKLMIRERRNWDATDATLIRRWQSKWKQGRAILLADAHARKEQRRYAPSQSAQFSSTGGNALTASEGSSAMLALMSLQQLSNGHWLTEMREAFRPAMQTYVELRDTIPSVMQTFRDLRDTFTPLIETIRDMQDSPTMRLIREMQQRP